MSHWDARQYLIFEDERTRPARDLLAQVPLRLPRIIADLGCGPGNSTRLLLERYPKARVIGVDNSPDMLEKARARVPHGLFIEGDVADNEMGTRWREGGPFDLIFANSVLQWVPDHANLLPSLVDLLTSGGVLALQMPDNLDQPSHRLVREVAASGPWSARLAGIERMKLASVADYYDMLIPYVAQVNIWHIIYQHPLDNVNAIVEWGKGAGLLPFIGSLDKSEKELFLADYTNRLMAYYPLRADNKILFAFPRLFIVAQK